MTFYEYYGDKSKAIIGLVQREISDKGGIISIRNIVES